ncbi:Arginyl-tRNA synthetase [Hordeum vulgare]|nr:Arginyl-tRNA synthetase [Hordeum vulgare]
MAVLRCRFSLGSIAGRLRQEVERLRLARNFGGAVKSCLADRCYAESCLVDRCYARQIFRSLRIWTDERRAVALLGTVVTSTDVWTGMDKADLFPEDGHSDGTDEQQLTVSMCMCAPDPAAEEHSLAVHVEAGCADHWFGLYSLFSPAQHRHINRSHCRPVSSCYRVGLKCAQSQNKRGIILLQSSTHSQSM